MKTYRLLAYAAVGLFLVLSAVGLRAAAQVPAEPQQPPSSPSVAALEVTKNWTFREAADSNWHPASVPGCVHTDLLNNNLIPDPYFGRNEERLQWIGEKDWVYQTLFDVPQEILGKDSVELVFLGLDTYATVTVNGTQLLAADNMFREWRKECKALLKPTGNRLAILFRNVFGVNLPKYKAAPFELQAGDNNDQADVKIAPYVRKAQFHFGWDWGPRLITCGVWRPVRVEGWSGVRVQTARITPERVSGAEAGIASVIEVRSSREQTVHLEVTADSVVLAGLDTTLRAGVNQILLHGVIPHPRLWWTNGLGEQYLYAVKASVKNREGLTDEYAAKIGVRSLEIVRDKDSLGVTFYVRLNGVPVFMKGADYVPQDNFQNRVTQERCEYLVKSAADAHMNMFRVWGGGIYEDDQFYSLCDRYGILVWQDMMFACAMYPGDKAFLANVRQEILDNVRRIRNHPSIALYCGNNENNVGWYTWGWKKLYPQEVQARYEQDMYRLFSDVIPAAVKEADPARYYLFSSPGAGYMGTTPMDGDIHYWGVWHGKEPFESFETNIARFISEYGFQSYPQLSSIMRFTGPQDRDIHSPVMLAHQRCMSDARKDKEYGNRLIASYMDMYMQKPKDFASYLYASQVLQAQAVRMAVEAHRRHMPVCMGSLYWQIDDCWPVASWSSMDYYGDWKAAQFYAKRLYEPVIIAPRFSGDEVAVAVVSDRLDGFSGELEVRVLDFDGKEGFSRKIPVSVRGNSSAVYATFRKSELTRGGDDARLVMVCVLRGTGAPGSGGGQTEGTVAQNISYFRQLKDLHLEKPQITVTVERTDTGYVVGLKSARLAKDVYLSLDMGAGPLTSTTGRSSETPATIFDRAAGTLAGGLSGISSRRSLPATTFSDNYFDLLPGLAKRVELKTPEEIRDIEKLLRVVSLVDSYE